MSLFDRYHGESGGLNEAFADMAGKGAERFVRGKDGVKWSVGGDITKVLYDFLSLS